MAGCQANVRHGLLAVAITTRHPAVRGITQTSLAFVGAAIAEMEVASLSGLGCGLGNPPGSWSPGQPYSFCSPALTSSTLARQRRLAAVMTLGSSSGIWTVRTEKNSRRTGSPGSICVNEDLNRIPATP
jgi:hypothetical protein